MKDDLPESLQALLYSCDLSALGTMSPQLAKR